MTDLAKVTVDTSVTASQVLEYIQSGGAVQIAFIEENPEDVARRINARILNASSPEELFGDAKVIHARDYLNRPFQLLAIDWRPSDIDGEGFPFYGVFQIADVNGEVHVLTTGAKSVLMKAAVAEKNGWLPLWVQIQKSDKPTAAGNFPLDMNSAPEPETAF